jgi:Tol biopolymer transport system component
MISRGRTIMKTPVRSLLALLAAAMLPACGSSGDTIIGQGAPAPGAFDGTVAFTADWTGDGRSEVYAGEIAGTRVIPAGPAVDATREVRDLRYSPDRKWISYRLDRQTPGNFTLMVVPADGGVAQDRTNLTTTTVNNYVWSPDSTMIAFTQSGGGFPGDLWVVTAFGTQTIANLSDSVAGGFVDPGYVWSPDSQYVAYQGDTAINDLVECFVARADGTSTNKVHPALPPGSDGAGSPAWASDSSRVAYVAEQDSTTAYDLYTSLPDGTGNAKINGTLAAGSVADFAWAPDGSRIVYRAQQDSATQFEIYTSLPNGTGNVKISGTLVAATNAISPKWSPDSSRVSYFAMQGTDTVPEMYTSLPTGTAGNVKVSAPRGAGGDLLLQMQWAPDCASCSEIRPSASADAMDLPQIRFSISSLFT